MSSSSSSSLTKAARRGVVVSSSLHGPRPLPLSVPGTTSPPPRPSKRPRVVVNDEDDVRAPATGPVIVYEHTPKVIHARPDEFKALVQRLTSRQPPTGTAGAGAGDDQGQEAAVLHNTTMAASSSQQDPLVLTLGQQHVPLPPPMPLGDHHSTPPPELPSLGGDGADFLLSPGSFLFSPATMQAIHELIS